MELSNSVFTIKTHVRHIIIKMSARSRTEAATKALRLGIIT